MDPPALPLEFDARGLVPVVVQDHLTGEIRMVAFATDEAVKKTLESGQATFWSRSRSEVWQKGLTSGNAIRVLRVLVDCDADCLVYQGEPSGNSCHTGAPTCFFREIEGGALKPYPAQQTLLGALEAVLEARKGATAAASYTKSLYEGGPAAIGAKIREEAGELAQAVEGENDQRVISEAADTLYHLLVGLRWRAIPFRRVLAELARRLGKSGHEEKASR
ncbi:MAG TPA: bifunctional phosphoribosyl-AMP cyclohydrolase/phosphoribosyl-ATP diphosphatase HisIE [Polyangiaceae bacterium]|jgi:phosphoribosyl-ATP pyrophosphohydrolase/phosphoribosyl-AMP cyclohydrolase|nr:bifunctional phosphoribosyl-AMP cyclohydrolase/phosphoribosyl-ATP diphosphatase HisIE [Polyangiaceae bacterium]